MAPNAWAIKLLPLHKFYLVLWLVAFIGILPILARIAGPQHKILANFALNF